MKTKVMFWTLAMAGVMSVSAARRVNMDCDTLDLTEYRAYAELAKEFGATHLAACQIEPSMWQWDRNRYDPYPNWSMHRPTLFKFVVPEELKPYIPADYAARNLARLKERVKILKEFGFKATFTGMEPAYLPEEAYRAHPNWRGPRCDQCRRARFEYYAPCMDDPEMRAIYVKGVEMLCREAPFESFDLMCNDSGSGLCWYPRLYPGPNGPARCRSGSMADRIINYLSVFQEGAAKAGLKGTINVNLNRYVSAQDIELTLPRLKPGQSLMNRTAGRAVKTNIVGFPNPFAEHTYPIYAMPRMVELVKQIQAASRDPEADLLLALRSLEEVDAIRLYRASLKKGIAEGSVARVRTLNDIAATFVGAANSEKLVSAWEAVEDAYARLEWAKTGGHVFLLGTTHQRWLTRPLVAFPNELKPEEKDYYRAFQFQAEEEEKADDLVRLQANRWLCGRGGSFAWEGTVNGTRPVVVSALKTVKALIPHAVDAESKRYLEGFALKLELYRAVMDNARHVVQYQFLIDEAKRNAPPVDRTEIAYDQGDQGFCRMNEIQRSEVDNTVAIIGILERAKKLGVHVIRTADRPEFENVMNLAPVDVLVGQLLKKIEVMENHRRDVTRLYRSLNR